MATRKLHCRRVVRLLEALVLLIGGVVIVGSLW
jgi:hypothetical protein